MRGYEPEALQGMSFEFGDPWAYYAKFWRAHEVDRLAALIPTPEVALDWGQTLRVPMVLYNGTTHANEVSITLAAPDGWTEKAGVRPVSVVNPEVPIRSRLFWLHPRAANRSGRRLPGQRRPVESRSGN